MKKARIFGLVISIVLVVLIVAILGKNIFNDTSKEVEKDNSK